MSTTPAPDGQVLLSLGHGYSARALGRRLASEGWRVIGTTRSADKAAAIAAEGAEPRIWPGADLTADLAAATHLLTSAAPDAEGDPVLRALPLAGHRFAWVGYLSTTGVYGDHGGAEVDEATPPAPSTERGRRRTAAEATWTALAAREGWPLAIFRLAGIYGPGRGPFEKVRQGTARRIVKPGQVFSRIHRDDIAQALAAAIARRAVGPFNLCDDDPAPPEDVIAHAAALLGRPVPPAEDFATAEMTPMARSFYAESKRVSNARLKRELGVRLIHSSYRDGLRALLDAEAGASAEGE